MAVSDGQNVNAAVTNAAFLSRTADSNTVAKVDMDNADTTDLKDVQRVVNEALGSLGIANQAATDASSDTYSSNNVVTNGDDRKVAIGKIDAEFDTSTGHDHDGVNSKAIDASSLGNFNNLFAEFQEFTFDAASGTSITVTSLFSGKSSGGDANTEGVITSAPDNRVEIVGKDDHREIEDPQGDRVYARITEAATVWTLSFFTNEAGTETAHSLSSQDIRFLFREVFNQNTRPTIPASLGLYDSLSAVEDIPDATATQPGKVSIAAQTFGGVKEFSSNPTTGGSNILSTDNTETVTNKDIDGTTASNTNRITVPKNTLANLQALTRKEGTIVYDTDADAFLGDDGVELKSLGGGGAGGGLDTFFIEDFETTDAADLTSGNSATPFDSGSLAGTLADEEGSPLSKTRSIEYTQASGSLNDWFHVDTVTVDPKNRGKFVASIVNANYDGDESDIKYLVWDNTNSLELESVFIKDSVSQRYVLLFAIPSNTTELKVGFQVAVENIGAILLWDDTEITLNAFGQADLGLSSWIDDGTTNITAVTSDPSKGTIVRDRSYYRLNGNSMDWIIQLETSTAGSAGSGAYLIEVPGGLEVDDGVIEIDTDAGATGYGTDSVGQGAATSTSTTTLFNVKVYDSTHVMLQAIGGTPIGSTSFSLGSAQSRYSFMVSNLPIKNLNQNGIVINALAPENSEILLQDRAGFGSTNTKIPRYTNLTTIGTALTATQSGTDGDSVTVNEDGIYSVNLVDPTTDTARSGISVNSAQLTTNIQDITAANRLAIAQASSGSIGMAACSANVVLSKGDVLRPHTQGTSGGTTAHAIFRVTKIGTLQKTGFQLPQTAYMQDEKSSGTSGGTFTSGAWQTRDLNVLTGDSYFVSLSSNQFTLIPGVYHIEAVAPAFRCGGHTSKLRNITDSTDEIIGSAHDSQNGSDGSNSSHLAGKLSIESSKTYELQHRCGTTEVGDGFGNANSFGVVEVYAQVKITKVE